MVNCREEEDDEAERTLAWPLAVNTVTGRLRRFTSVSSVSAWEIRYQYGQSCIRLSLPDWRSNCAFFFYIYSRYGNSRQN